MTEYSPAPGKDEAYIWNLINEDWSKMSFVQKRFWELVRIDPERWRSPPYKFRPREAWVVAIVGQHIIWYNEIWLGDVFDGMDSGFSRATYYERGLINKDFPSASPLEDVVQSLLREVTGDLVTPQAQP